MEKSKNKTGGIGLKNKMKSLLASILVGAMIFTSSSVTAFAEKPENPDNEQTNELTPEALYQTSWRGTGHCEAWTVQNMGVGMQFVDTQKGKVNWEGYDEIDITYTIEGKYITFNSNALYLGGAPWIIKSYTQKHITIIQNEISPDKEKVATIELEKID